MRKAGALWTWTADVHIKLWFSGGCLLHWPPRTCALASSLLQIIQSALPVGLIKAIIQTLSVFSFIQLHSGSSAGLLCEVKGRNAWERWRSKVIDNLRHLLWYMSVTSENPADQCFHSSSSVLQEVRSAAPLIPSAAWGKAHQQLGQRAWHQRLPPAFTAWQSLPLMSESYYVLD